MSYTNDELHKTCRCSRTMYVIFIPSSGAIGPGDWYWMCEFCDPHLMERVFGE